MEAMSPLRHPVGCVHFRSFSGRSAKKDREQQQFEGMKGKNPGRNCLFRKKFLFFVELILAEKKFAKARKCKFMPGSAEQ